MGVVVGVGAGRGVPAREVLGLVDAALAAAGLSRAEVSRLATVDTKSEEPALRTVARLIGVPLTGYPAAALAIGRRWDAERRGGGRAARCR